MKFKYNFKRPTRDQLEGMSPSQFKTFLKQRGHKITRDFFKSGSVSYRRGRAYRFRWWSEGGFVVDVSCPLADFDRWANSVDNVVNFQDWRQTCTT